MRESSVQRCLRLCAIYMENMMKEKCYQLPLRMPNSLAIALDAASESTGMSRSKLCRMGVSRLLSDLRNTGRTDSMRQFKEHYREI